MITSKDKLKSIVSFKEELDNQSLPNSQLFYLEMVSEFDEERMRAIKSHNRDLVIDIILDEKDESEWDKRGVLPSTLEDQLSPFGGGMIDTIAPKIMSMNVSGQKFQDYETLYVEVVDYINNLTSVGKTFTQATAPQLNFTITNDSTKTDEENYQYNSRRVISKILASSNIIAMEGRVGPGTGVLIGKNVANKVDLLPLSNSGINVIIEPLIDTDKIIVCRGGRADSSGIILMVYPNDKRYFLKETPLSWSRQYCWFNIT
jgi:hypothetical protein